MGARITHQIMKTISSHNPTCCSSQAFSISFIMHCRRRLKQIHEVRHSSRSCGSLSGSYTTSLSVLAFITHCLEPAEQGAFKYFSTTHIDWRWEFLEKALNKLVPLLHILFMRFDVGAIQRTVGTVVMDSILSPVATLIATNPHFDTACELYRVVGTTIEHYAKKLEGCWCHENIWKQSKGYKRRRQELETHTGNRRCVWKGRMGPWWVAAGIRLMLAELARCSSDALANAIARAPPDVASRIMQSLKTTRARIIEILEAKLDFFLPHTVSGNRDLLGRVRW